MQPPVPAAAIAVASFKMTTCAAIRALQVHDFLMNAPGPATAAVVERSGPRAAIALGLVIYVVVVGGLWACGSDDALYPVVTAGGRGERLVQQAFFGLVVVLALGWNFMWLASTSALDAAARRRRVNQIFAACRWRRVASAPSPRRRLEGVAVWAPDSRIHLRTGARGRRDEL